MSFSCLQCKLNSLEEIEIVSLKCKHIFCWSCIGTHVVSKLSTKIKCPLSTCNKNINDNIIRRALPLMKVEEYEKLCLETFAKNEENCFKCLLPECEHMGYFNSKEVIFECSSCKLFNCVMCNATHPFLSCKEYQKKKNSAHNNVKDMNELEVMKKEELAKALKELKIFQNKKHLKACEIMESLSVVPNDEIFICTLCVRKIPKDGGIKLRNCYHMFCRDCLRGIIVNSTALPIKCAETSCEWRVEDREIREILNNQEFEIYNIKSLTQAQSQLNNVRHCTKPNCMYYGILGDSKMEYFVCPNCKSKNCVSCETVHKDNETCDQYVKRKSHDLKTMQFIEKEIKDGKCMQCPKCKSLVKKVGGCNWIKCSSCKLELCWILKIPRWGPKGRGDESGGCRCRVNGIRCHVDCPPPGCMPHPGS